MSNATATGARLHGAVMHVITKGMHNDVSACGRVVMPGKGAAHRVCRTCVRINGDAFKLDAAMRKAERESRMSRDISEIAEEFISWEFQLTAYELEMTREKIAKINARCAKRGIPGGLNVEYREETKKEKNDFGIEIETIVYMVKITGIAPKLPDWDFVATLDYDPNAGLIVRTYPGVNSINRANLREGWCDHCQTNRYRKNTYVMRNRNSGEEIQVGSACIKDFTGWEALPYSAERMQKDVEEMSGDFGSYPRDVSTLTVLSVAWACVTEFGYVRSREIGATVDMVRDVINPPRKISEDYRLELARLSRHADEMMNRAKELRAWILSDEFSGTSEYVLNMKAIAGAEMVSSRNYGLLVSAPQAWARFLEKSFIKEKEKAPESNWIGEIGERWELSLTLKSVKYIETMYGCSTLHKFTDASGNVFSWFASSADYGDNVGDTFRVSATIKAHSNKYGVETGLTRVKVIDDVQAESRKIKDAPIKVRDEIAVSALTAKGIDLDGVYVMNGEFFKIRQTKGTAYAVKFTANGWEYSHRSVNVIRPADMATAEDAARFGKTHAHCVYCVRPLTDERSLTVGYGETCAGTHGLPWGE